MYSTKSAITITKLGILTTFLLVILTSEYRYCLANDFQREPSKEICADYRIYYNQTRKCYNQGQQGPCGKLMVLTESKGNPQIGECTCKQFSGETRPTAHWPEKQRCYFIFDQGPCKKGEWLVVTEKSPHCDRIPCPALYAAQHSQDDSHEIFSPNPTFLFTYQGKCYTTFDQAFCPVGKIAVFNADRFAPKCISEDDRSFGAQGIASGSDNICPNNQEPDNAGGCEPNANI